MKPMGQLEVFKLFYFLIGNGCHRRLAMYWLCHHCVMAVTTILKQDAPTWQSYSRTCQVKPRNGFVTMCTAKVSSTWMDLLRDGTNDESFDMLLLDSLRKYPT